MLISTRGRAGGERPRADKGARCWHWWRTDRSTERTDGSGGRSKHLPRSLVRSRRRRTVYFDAIRRCGMARPALLPNEIVHQRGDSGNPSEREQKVTTWRSVVKPLLSAAPVLVPVGRHAFAQAIATADRIKAAISGNTVQGSVAAAGSYTKSMVPTASSWARTIAASGALKAMPCVSKAARTMSPAAGQTRWRSGNLGE